MLLLHDVGAGLAMKGPYAPPISIWVVKLPGAPKLGIRPNKNSICLYAALGAY
jgi:hypothetical protein